MGAFTLISRQGKTEPAANRRCDEVQRAPTGRAE